MTKASAHAMHWNRLWPNQEMCARQERRAHIHIIQPKRVLMLGPLKMSSTIHQLSKPQCAL